ncbi:MAG TPA: N-acetyltransferase [Terriglobales bacterium]|nr:N-acetyltransferase [Terriglobales bacterium]
MIREARPADFEALWRIDQACFESGIAYSRRELAWYMQRPGAFTLIVEAETKAPVAFIVAAPLKKGAGHIITLDVLPRDRRSGLGSRLLDAAEQRLRDAGCAAVSLETAVNNHVAIRFYMRHGYSIERTIPRYYSDGLDALAMTKNLT